MIAKANARSTLVGPIYSGLDFPPISQYDARQYPDFKPPGYPASDLWASILVR